MQIIPQRVIEGSTPVCTGKSLILCSKLICMTVYPRVYGEIVRESILSIFALGLPPCVRGNLFSALRWRMRLRSTPVCTGKSLAIGSLSTSPQVYPRVYGEIKCMSSLTNTYPGLPPCVRGNLSYRSKYVP